MAETGWQEELRSRGYRVTPQRQLVLEAVAALEHGTPEESCAEVQRTAKGVNISTIYRTLELLEELGLVKHAHLGHGPPNYHLSTEADHVHLRCRSCGRVEDEARCTQECDDARVGPDGFDCRGGGDGVVGACWPAPDAGGCNVASAAGLPGVLALFGLALLGLRRRRA